MNYTESLRSLYCDSISIISRYDITSVFLCCATSWVRKANSSSFSSTENFAVLASLRLFM